MAAKNKIRCNMYLNKDNVELVKKFIDGTGLTLSSYFDLFIGKAAENINLFYEEIGRSVVEERNGEKFFDIYTAYKILGIFDMGGVPLTDQQVKAIQKGEIKIDNEMNPDIQAYKKLQKIKKD